MYLYLGVTTFVYDQFGGPVKNMDVGYIVDAWGYIYNEQGNKYCVLHQFRAQRNPDVKAMYGRYAISSQWENDELPIGEREPRGRRFSFHDSRFSDGFHPIVHVMEARNLTAAGPLAKITPVPHLNALVHEHQRVAWVEGWVPYL